MKISDKKREKIFEQILFFLYSKFPQPMFTSHIAQEIARDEDFVKRLLKDLAKKQLVSEIKKNPLGIDYLKRTRWKLREEVYQKYKIHQ
jgi:predicted transcriptional regulator with HTH domain